MPTGRPARGAAGAHVAPGRGGWEGRTPAAALRRGAVARRILRHGFSSADISVGLQCLRIVASDLFPMMGVIDPSDQEELQQILDAVPHANCVPQKRFIAFCDVLGFRSLVMTQELAELGRTYAEILRRVKGSRISFKTYPSPNPGVPQRYQAGTVVFSDSILVWSDPVPAPEPGAEGHYFAYLGALFGCALHGGLPLRVGVAYGDCIVDPEFGLYVGRPIIDAYETEELQDWVGIACHVSCFESPQGKYLCMRGASNGWQVGPLIEYDVPLKTGKSAGQPVRHSIDWPHWSMPEFGGFDEVKAFLSSKVKGVCGHGARASVATCAVVLRVPTIDLGSSRRTCGHRAVADLLRLNEKTCPTSLGSRLAAATTECRPRPQVSHPHPEPEQRLRDRHEPEPFHATLQ